MPKATKERPKHSASLTSQLQNDRSPVVSESQRAKRKRKEVEAKEAEDQGELIVAGKMSRQILAMAREQQEEDEDEIVSEEKGSDEEMKWRENEYGLFIVILTAERIWKILMNIPMKKSTTGTMQRKLWYAPKMK